MTSAHTLPAAGAPRRALAPSLALACALALTACGGGDEPFEPESSEASEVDADAAAAAATGDAPATAAAAPAPVDPVALETQPGEAPTAKPLALAPAPITATCGLANFEAEARQRINAYRARGASCGTRGTFAPTGPLAWATELNNAAARHSKDMATRNFFSHTGSDGSTAPKRITQAGYTWRAWAENISGGRRTVQTVVDGWMASPGHCANIMNPNLRDMGLACVKTTTSTYGWYWTMDLGRRY